MRPYSREHFLSNWTVQDSASENSGSNAYLGMLPNIQEPQFPGLYNGDNDSLYFTALLWGLNGVKYKKHLTHTKYSINTSLK